MIRACVVGIRKSHWWREGSFEVRGTTRHPDFEDPRSSPRSFHYERNTALRPCSYQVTGRKDRAPSRYLGLGGQLWPATFARTAKWRLLRMRFDVAEQQVRHGSVSLISMIINRSFRRLTRVPLAALANFLITRVRAEIGDCIDMNSTRWCGSPSGCQARSRAGRPASNPAALPSIPM